MISDNNQNNSNENSDDDSYELNKEECFICSKFMNIKLRLPIKCDFCDYIVCTECIKRYLKEIKIDPHCMNVDCKTKWTTKYLSKIFICSIAFEQIISKGLILFLSKVIIFPS